MTAERTAWPPLTRRAVAWRYGFAAGFGGLLWVGQAIEPAGQGLVVVVDLVLGVGAIIALRWRRRYPMWVAVLTTLVSSVSIMGAAAWIIAFLSLTTTRRWRAIVPVAVLSVLTSYLYEVVRPTGSTLPWWATALIGLLFTAILLAVGLYVGARRELHRVREEAAEREQANRLEEARRSERTRIAREMHDVLAHRMSLVSLHAGAMTYRTDLSREELQAAARIVQDNAHRALVDLRDVLGVLRDAVPPDASDTPGVVGTGSTARGAGVMAPPQPTLAGLADLVQEARDSGTPVVLDQRVPDLTAVPDTLGRTAYRVVQEALTNARKHAPGSPVTLTVSGAPGQRLSVEATNPLQRSPVGAGAYAWFGPPDVVPGAGVGLVGLHERTALAGGGLEHGVTPDQRYRVAAWLPWPV